MNIEFKGKNLVDHIIIDSDVGWEYADGITYLGGDLYIFNL
jgi:hypothetical protein